ncbi:MAG: hypothetical protein IKH54_00625 [Bacilli bacterium]|nr:hypothetical protein [Bacilli bacterium]
MVEENIIHKVIKEICEEEKIEFKLLSRDWIIRLKKDNKERFISGYKFDLNSHALGEILDDKYGLYEVLREDNIPIIDHNILYSKDNNNDFAIGYNDINKVKEFFYNNNQSIVIKPNKGTCGNGVYHITNINDIEPLVQKLHKDNYSISYCPYYDIEKEYRIIVLNNQIKLIYQKNKPVVIGDGIKTIKELLLDFNYNYFKNIEFDNTYNRVLEKDEIFEYNWKFNLSTGATAQILNNKEVEENLKRIVEQVLSKLEIKFASIDIIKTNDNKYLVMEINSGVMMKNIYYLLDKKIVKDIYKEAIKTLFE